jgi:hypothetical protein
MKFNKKRTVPIVAFFLLAVTITFSIYKDFGIAWDEQRERKSGALAAIYINSKFNYAFISKEAVRERLSDQESKAVVIINKSVDYADPNNYLTYEDKDYGVVFTLLLTAVEVVFDPATSQAIYELRHLTINLFFLVSLIFLYQLLWIRFNDWRYALLGPLFMVLTPVVFAHSFFNPKDIPFMSVYIIGIYTLVLFLKQKNYKTALLHALSCAILIDMRIPGIILPALTLGFIVLDILFNKEPLKFSKTIAPVILVYGALMLCFIVAFWPYLWNDPLGNFLAAFNNMKKFRWSGQVLFFGKFIEVAKNVPWYYIPGWLLINTPLLYLLGFFVTLGVLIKAIIKIGISYYTTDEGKFNLIALAAFLMPLLAIIVLNSVVYNGWRQVFFIYPPFLLLCISGIYYLHKFAVSLPYKGLKFLVPLLVSLSSIWMVTKLYTLHPFQNIYFNVFAGGNIEERFECDYWALSFRKNMEYILRNDTRDSIRVFVEDITPAKVNSLALSEADKKRLVVVTERMGAEYFITKYDNAASRSDFLKKHELLPSDEFYAVIVDDVKLSSTFKLK